jgi:general secretion pathway protein K
MRRQRGVALVLALLVVALATLLAVELFTASSTAIARREGLARAEEAALLAQGMEDFALALLARDEASGDGIDTRLDAWARPLPPLPVPGGVIRGELVDLDGRFNLNSLVRNGARDPVAIARLRRLLAALELEPALADRIADWIDADSEVAGEGAEDLQYLRADPPYRAANRPFGHVSELRRVLGVDAEVYARLVNEVAALPADAGININTMSVAGLMSLADGISVELARQLWEGGNASYRSMTELIDRLTAAGVVMEPQDMQDLKVTSRYFLAQAELVLGERHFRFFSLLQRQPGGGRVLQRTAGAWDLPVSPAPARGLR